MGKKQKKHCKDKHYKHEPCDGFFVQDKCSIPLFCPPPNLVHLRLAGLNGNLNFQLIQLKGRPAKVQFECAEQIETVEGTICNVGTDFIDVLRNDQSGVVTILQSRITNIEFTNPDEASCSSSIENM